MVHNRNRTSQSYSFKDKYFVASEFLSLEVSLPMAVDLTLTIAFINIMLCN